MRGGVTANWVGSSSQGRPNPTESNQTTGLGRREPNSCPITENPILHDPERGTAKEEKGKRQVVRVRNVERAPPKERSLKKMSGEEKVKSLKKRIRNHAAVLQTFLKRRVP